MRFSEDIDITVFRDDLDEPASVGELESLSRKKRQARLAAIRDACRAYITGPLREFLDAQLRDATAGAGRIEIDDADPDGQTLLVWYPEAEPRDGAYVQPAVRIKGGAKSALDRDQFFTHRRRPAHRGTYARATGAIASRRFPPPTISPGSLRVS